MLVIVTIPQVVDGAAGTTQQLQAQLIARCIAILLGKHVYYELQHVGNQSGQSWEWLLLGEGAGLEAYDWLSRSASEDMADAM